MPYTGALKSIDTGAFGITTNYLNVTGDSNFNMNNISNVRNVFGEHIHMLSNASLDSYFNAFSAGNSTNETTLRLGKNATTIAAIEQCTTGCHAYNLSWIRVWPSYIEVSSPKVDFTGKITASNTTINPLTKPSGITMYSPNRTAYCLYVQDNGTPATSYGACL